MNDTSSVFQPDDFLDQTTDQEGSTYMTPVPVGEYRAICEDIKFREEESKKTNKKIHLADVFWKIDDEAVEAQIGRKAVLRQSVFVDITQANGKSALDFNEGKNVGLNRVRDAVGQNRAGASWSPRMLIGQMATVMVTQRPDDNDPKIIYNDVKRVGTLT